VEAVQVFDSLFFFCFLFYCVGEETLQTFIDLVSSSGNQPNEET